MGPKKKQKLRVALRKNRKKRARDRNLMRKLRRLPVEEVDVPSGEPVSGKGELTRRRTVVAVADDHGDIVREVDLSRCVPGRVLSAAGLTSLVAGEDGHRYECSVRRLLRTIAREERNVVVAGDRVLLQPLGRGQGVIERIEPRQGVLSRGAGHREHVLVANIDQVVIVVSAAEPPLKTNLVDRFLISAAKGGVGSIVCINKADLVDAAELQPTAGLYGGLGYEVVLASAATGTGVGRLRRLLQGRQSVLAGQSGVGKSSLLNRIQPDLQLRTGDVSSWTGKGRHTTRRAVLLPLDVGGWVVDTPGIRQLGLWNVLPGEVEGFFVEFRPFVPRCKFPDCSHTHEIGCGVMQAVQRGLIHTARYESYLRIVAGE